MAGTVRDIKILPFEHRSTVVQVDVEEFVSFICIGGPATAKVKVSYVPKERVMELISFRQYLQKYKKRQMILEEVGVEIFEDLKKALEPKWLAVHLESESYTNHGRTKVYVQEAGLYK